MARIGGCAAVVVWLGCSQPAATPGVAPPPANPVAAQPRPTQPEPKAASEPLIVVDATEVPGANNCPKVVVTATRGGEHLGAVELQEECEEAPDYECDDDGHGCNTTLYEVGDRITFGSRSFVWVSGEESWAHNDFANEELYGYACGELRAVYSYTSSDQGQYETVELSAVGDSHEKLSATSETTDNTAEPPTSDETSFTLVWDAAACKYVEGS